MIFSKTITETLPLKKPKTLKLYPRTWYVNEKFLIMITYYISLKGHEKCYSTVTYSKTSTETILLKKSKNLETLPSNLVCQ